MSRSFYGINQSDLTFSGIEIALWDSFEGPRSSICKSYFYISLRHGLGIDFATETIKKYLVNGEIKVSGTTLYKTPTI